MIIDSHCHLNMKDFTADLSDIIKSAKNNNINGMLTISTKVEEFKNISNIAKNNKNIWYSLGIHPHNVNNNYKDLQAAIAEFKSDKKFMNQLVNLERSSQKAGYETLEASALIIFEVPLARSEAIARLIATR